ncbi:MAG TPA: GNAT family N-acetyltransferase, partial [Ktedonobacteraceae bacterium]|nr:GNAT family N-acetyltransferase [Ktedonobacteraceae bacterium]
IFERLHPSDSALEIRLARPEDKEEVQAMAELIGRHQANSPVYAPFFPEEVSDRRESFARLLSDPDVTFWLAFKDGQALGYQLQVPAETETDNLLIPDSCTELAVAATFAHARGQGVGQALTRHALVAAQAAGYTYCVTDWRTTNLLSSRFWPRQGFRPAYYRLRRSIDSRIAWATIR